MKLRTTLPCLILCATGAHLAIACFLHVRWMMTGNLRWLTPRFQYQSAFFLTACCGLELGLSYVAWRQFARDDELKQAWLLMMLAALCHLTGTVLTHLLGSEPALAGSRDPVIALADLHTAVLLYQSGSVIGGPLHLLLLGGGLFFVLRVYLNLGLLSKLQTSDYALLGIVFAYTLRFLYEVLAWYLSDTEQLTFARVINWANDPLLSVLLLEAVFIRRAVIGMGRSLIAACWGAFVAAVFLTSVGNMGLWATWHGWLKWPLSSVTWYIWFFASAAFALGPAFQVEASLRAKKATGTLLRESGVMLARP
jgi:hypothetical protein